MRNDEGRSASLGKGDPMSEERISDERLAEMVDTWSRLHAPVLHSALTELQHRRAVEAPDAEAEQGEERK